MAKGKMSKGKRTAILRAFRLANIVSEKRISKQVGKFMRVQSDRILSGTRRELNKLKILSEKADDEITKKEADKIAKNTVNKSINFEEENIKLFKLLSPELFRSSVLGAEKSDKIFKLIGDDKKLIGIRNTKLTKWARQHGSKQVRRINGHTVKKLQKNISDGLINGESLDEIMDRIKNVTKINNTSRLRTIARTESQISIQTGNFENIDVSGVKKIKWVTAKDELVRGNPKGKYPKSKANHFILDQVIIKLGELFPNGLRYPGDPLGAAWEIINCRCVMVPADF